MDNQWCKTHGFSHLGSPEALCIQLDDLRAAMNGEQREIIVRSYSGRNAAALFETEAVVFAEFGYFPVTQSGTSSTAGPSTAGILVGGLLAFGGKKSTSTLTVTFRRESSPQRPPSSERSSLRDRLAQLEEAKDAGLLSEDEYASRRVRILDEM